MKLLRVGAPGLEKPAILHTDGTYRDLSAIVPEIRGLVLTPEGLNRIRAVRDGELYRADFKTRMTGTGIFAEQVRQQFHTACRRAGIDGQRPGLSVDSFRVPARAGDQMDLGLG